MPRRIVAQVQSKMKTIEPRAKVKILIRVNAATPAWRSPGTAGVTKQPAGYTVGTRALGADARAGAPPGATPQGKPFLRA